jgi:hypothetical protein
MTANLLEATTRWFVLMTAELVVLFLALSFLIGHLGPGSRRRKFA